jgi:hypothetical protein
MLEQTHNADLEEINKLKKLNDDLNVQLTNIFKNEKHTEDNLQSYKDLY